MTDSHEEQQSVRSGSGHRRTGVPARTMALLQHPTVLESIVTGRTGIPGGSNHNLNPKVSATKQKIRVLVADDHPVVRKGLQSCLSRQDRLKIVGEATDGEDALTQALALMPDVVLLDISMPRRDGLAVTEALRRDAPNIKILILSVHSNREYIFRVIQAGAHGYISKES